MSESTPTYDRIKRRLGRAEGYLMLGLYARALEILEAGDWATMRFEAEVLHGDALRQVGRLFDAIRHLEVAASLRPGDVTTAISLGWCYKRTNRMAQAIDALLRANHLNPREPLLYYNLACYWGLAGDLNRAVRALCQAIDIDPELRSRLALEPDFEPIRDHPGFRRLVADGPSTVA